MHSYYDDTSGVGAALALLIFLPFILIFVLGAYVLTALFLMKIFEKAGVQGKWRAWVPVYNTMIFAKLGDLNPFWQLILWAAGLILFWIPVLGQLIVLAAFVYQMLAAWRVGLKLQKEPVWLILYFFVTVVWLGINAYDRSRWNPAVPPAPWAGNFLADNTVWEGVPAQSAPAGGYQPQPAPGGYPPAAPGMYQPPAAPGAYPPPAATPPAATTPPAPGGYPPAAPPASTTPPPAPEDPEAPKV